MFIEETFTFQFNEMQCENFPYHKESEWSNVICLISIWFVHKNALNHNSNIKTHE